MSVTWVLNGNSKHEISSKEHVLQLMTQGSLYTDAGFLPATYWASRYEQTVDIDLESDTNITPIGTNSTRFSGSYDGAGHSISNWSYVDDPDVTGRFSALFGYASNATLENLRWTGVWTHTAVGHALQAGFLTGRMAGGTVRNIDCVFDEGTYLECTNFETMGAVIGEASSAYVYVITVRGTIATAGTVLSSGSHCGGVIGRIKSYKPCIGLRNLAMWPDGISGRYVGGIAGFVDKTASLTHSTNAMIGDINGSICAGGIIGFKRNSSSDAIHTLVNSMRGNICTDGNTAFAGGVVGQLHLQSGPIDVSGTMNYMTGNVVSTNSTSAGLIGNVYRDASHACSISNSVVAMNGNAEEVAIGSIDFTPTVSTKIDTAFGFTYTTATYGSTSDAFTGTTSTLFADLDYLPLTFTDNASNSYEHEMVSGNVGGSASYTQYTHAIISKNDISGPYHIEFDLAGDTTEFPTYLSVGTSTFAYTDGLLTVLDRGAHIVYDYAGTTALFTTQPLVHLDVTGTTAIDITVVITPIAEAEAYQIRYARTSGEPVTIAHSGFIELSKRVTDLSPGVEYEVFLYFLPVGLSVYTLDGSRTATTLDNTAANYDLSVYGTGGKYDLSGVKNMRNMKAVMSDLFTSGDKLSVNLGKNKKTTTFVKLGESVSIPDEAAFLPFTAGNVSGQEVTLMLSDNTSQVHLLQRGGRRDNRWGEHVC